MNDEVYRVLNNLKDNPDELGGYLMQLVKQDSNAIKYIDVYKELINSTNWYLKKVALYALLFVFRIKDDCVIEKAQQILINKEEDLDPRGWAAAGIGKVYEHTSNRRFIEIFYSILIDSSEEPNLRLSCLHGILIIGSKMTDADISRRLVRDVLSSEELLSINIKEFSIELNNIMIS